MSFSYIEDPRSKDHGAAPTQGDPASTVVRRNHTFLPSDVIQNVIEYVCSLSALMAFRGVSRRCCDAASDAVGYVNGRVWDKFTAGMWGDETMMLQHYATDHLMPVVTSGILCLGYQLKELRVAVPVGTNINQLLSAAQNLTWLELRPLAQKAGPLTHKAGPRPSQAQVLHRIDFTIAPRLAVLDVEGFRMPPVITLPPLLTNLSLAHTHVTQEAVSAIADLTLLERLNLSGCTAVVDVRPILSCRKLTELNLSDTSVSRDGIAGLETLPVLQQLNLKRCMKINDVSALGSCPSLKHLNLSACSIGDRGFSGLQTCSTLQHLDLSGCQRIRHVTQFETCSSLTTLDISYTVLSQFDIAAWKKTLSFHVNDVGLWWLRDESDVLVRQMS
jgi:hypothetical protein